MHTKELKAVRESQIEIIVIFLFKYSLNDIRGIVKNSSLRLRDRFE